MLLLSLVLTVNAFEIGLSDRGFELGWSGKRHFKLLNSYEACFFTESFGVAAFSSEVYLLTQWLNLRKSIVHCNFMSGVSFVFTDPIFMHITILSVEPEIRISETVSFYLRANIFGMFFDLFYNMDHYTYSGIMAPVFTYSSENLRDVTIGIRLQLRHPRH